MQLDCGISTLRPFRLGDEDDLVQHANNPKIAAFLRDRFPHPYTRADAEWWIAHVEGQNPTTNFAVCVEGHVVGGIGLILGDDINRISAEVGYWLSEAFWGRGIMTASLQGIVRHAFAALPINRIFAGALADNAANLGSSAVGNY
jgi:RimJ/RimL family protein N-acetyltransferase